jgi:hypothetical protein
VSTRAAGTSLGSPPSAGRRRNASRWVAGLSLAVVFGGGGWATLAFFRHQREALVAPATPYRPDSLVGLGPDRRSEEAPPRPGVVLYVSGHCPFCRQELEDWSRLLASHRRQRPPWVILAPDTPVREARTLLGESFRGRWTLDTSGSIGRSLRVRAIPFTAVLDSAGVVIEAHQGVSSPLRLARMASLVR